MIEKNCEGVMRLFFEEKHSRSDYCITLHYENMQTVSHCQTSMELLFISRGSVEALRHNQVYRLKAGECIWILPFDVHYYHTIEPNQATVFIFSPDWMPDFDQLTRDYRLCCPVIPFEPEEMELLHENQSDRFLKKSVLYRLAARALAQGTERKGVQEDRDPMIRMMLFIQEHFREEITLKDMAENLGYTYHYTSHLFQKYMPAGFSEILSGHRLDEAVSLMRKGRLTMSEVAEQSGFSTVRNFNYAFKKRFGMSPSAFLIEEKKNLCYIKQE
ncbi:MAG: helix-turn-helix transcriptional regulator [Clostridia bacterium]|nr:helix-turn-helix transcriptional regulator [Clostridia bacterium]